MENNHNPDNLSTKRIEGLSDGVFGIAMTLLIFKIDVPDVPSGLNIDTELPKVLITLLPQFENYLMSFILLGLYWMRHQIQFKYIQESDKVLMWINIFFLVFVGFVPFTTALLMEYADHTLPQVLYALNLLFISLSLSIHWMYATSNHRLVDKLLPQAYIRFTRWMNFSSSIIFTICIGIAFISPRVSLTMMYFIPIFYFVINRVQKAEKRKHIIP